MPNVDYPHPTAIYALLNENAQIISTHRRLRDAMDACDNHEEYCRVNKYAFMWSQRYHGSFYKNGVAINTDAARRGYRTRPRGSNGNTERDMG